MGHFNKANLLVIITLTLSIFASNIVCRSFDGSVEDDSCGYTTNGYDDSDRALVMSDDDQCHTFSQYVPDLDNAMRFGCAWWMCVPMVDVCIREHFCLSLSDIKSMKTFPETFAIGP